MNIFLEAILLVTALSLDSLTAGFSYGAGKIRIPLISVLVISGVCSASLLVSMFAGSILGNFIPLSTTKGISFSIMFILGAVKVFDSGLKRYIIKKNGGKKELTFKAFNLKFILNIYAEPENADSDKSRVLSAKEALYLAIALSIDSLAAGFGAGMGEVGLGVAALFCFATTFLSVLTGCFFGNKVSGILPDISPLGGIILIVLAFLKLG